MKQRSVRSLARRGWAAGNSRRPVLLRLLVSAVLGERRPSQGQASSNSSRAFRPPRPGAYGSASTAMTIFSGCDLPFHCQTNFASSDAITSDVTAFRTGS